MLRTWKVYHDIGMAHGRKEFIQQIPGTEFDTGCIDIGMAGEIFLFLHCIPVNKQLDMILCIIHKGRDTDETGRDIQMHFHIFLFRK